MCCLVFCSDRMISYYLKYGEQFCDCTSNSLEEEPLKALTLSVIICRIVCVISWSNLSCWCQRI